MSINPITRALRAQEVLDINGEATMLHYIKDAPFCWTRPVGTDKDPAGRTHVFTDQSIVEFHNHETRPHYHFRYPDSHHRIQDYTAPADPDLITELESPHDGMRPDPTNLAIACALVRRFQEVPYQFFEFRDILTPAKTDHQRVPRRVTDNGLLAMAMIRASIPNADDIISRVRANRPSVGRVACGADIHAMAADFATAVKISDWQNFAASVKQEHARLRRRDLRLIPTEIRANTSQDQMGVRVIRLPAGSRP